MKKIFLFAAAAAMLAACSSENDLATTQQQAVNETDANLITFDAYTSRSTTRAGYPGEVTTGNGTDPGGLTGTGDLMTAGFGVFAYYTDNFDYTPLYVPNFMYNEQVTYDGSKFTYGLPKYWPNEHGSAAASADQDRVSFFAYAPYVEVDPSTGMLADGGSLLDASDEKLQWGITGMKRNTLQGDPVVQYITSFDQDKSVDLCWATTGSSPITWSTNSSTQTIAAGYPWLNVRKPDGAASSDAAKVKFNFQHATSQLTVTVKTNFDEGWTPTTDAQTKVWVRSIRFTGIAHKAALNLNNPKTANPNKARWMDYYGTNELELGESVTVYDGRKDGSEGMAEALAPNEAVLGLNPEVVQDENQIKWNSTTKVYEWGNDDASKVRNGVKGSPVNLFCDNLVDYIYVIPTGEKVNVEIVYDVETIDKKLPTMLSDGATNGSTIENRITKAITFGSALSKLENGKHYTINLILGLKDVMFDAEVSPWVNETPESNVHLPMNMPSYAATGPGLAGVTATVPWDLTSYKFAITGLASGEAVAAAGATDNLSDPSTNSADATGIATEQVTIAQNNTVKDVEATAVTWTGNNSAKGISLVITQKAHPLGLGIDKESDKNNIILTAASGVTVDWAVGTGHDIATMTDGQSETNSIVVYKNGVPLPYSDAALTAIGKFNWNNTNHKIQLYDGEMLSGQTYTIKVKAGDAAEETYSFRTAAVTFPETSRTVSRATGPSKITIRATSPDGTIAYSLSDGSTGSTYDNSTGELTVGSTNGTATLTATVTPVDNGYIYPVKTATYTLIITD